MSSALLKYANKKVAKPTAVVTEAAAPAPAWATASTGASTAEPSTTGFKVADVSSEQVVLTEEEELKQKREQDAIKAKFHTARAGLKAEPSATSGATDAPAPAPVPAPAPAPAATGWRSRTVAASQAGTTPSATTAAPVPATTAAGGKSTWRDREAARLAAGPTAAATSSWSKPVAAPVMNEESFPTLGGPAAAAPKPATKASAWGSVAAVKPSAAAVVASNIVKAAPAPASAAGIPKAPEAAAPVDAKLGVLFEKLSLSSRLELSSAQYNAKIDEAVKGAIDSESTSALISTLRTIGGSRSQLTEAIVRLLWLGLDSDASQQGFVDIALVELLDAKVVGRDNVANGIWEVVADMDSLLLDVPKAVSYLAVMLKSVVVRKVFPTARLPEKVAAAMGVTIDPSTDPEDIVIDEGEEYEDDDDEYYEDYDAEDDEELQRELGIANKNMKAKNKHMKKDDF